MSEAFHIIDKTAVKFNDFQAINAYFYLLSTVIKENINQDIFFISDQYL